MASSTNAPIAIAIPPKLMVLMVKPKSFKTIIVTKRETGMAMSEISRCSPIQ